MTYYPLALHEHATPALKDLYTVVSKVEAAINPNSIFRDRDVLLRVYGPIALLRYIRRSFRSHKLPNADNQAVEGIIF